MTKTKDLDYKYIFGPVPSRRLGRSLGLDIVPHKTCSLDCVYCECGKTTHLTTKRREYVPLNRIFLELETFLLQDAAVDFITFSGSGEPTLHSGISDIVRFLKTAFPAQRLALLTNGSLLYEPETREAVLDLDLVKISLDAVYNKNFKRINRPCPGLDPARVVEGLKAFRKIFQKRFWVEVFLVPGCNDDEGELKQIRDVIDALNPDRIQLNTLDRPGTESWVKPADPKVLTEIAAYLYNAEIIKPLSSASGTQVSAEAFDERLLSTLKRRPCTAEDVSRILGADPIRVRKHLEAHVAAGIIVQKEMPRGVFYMRRT